MTIRPPAPSASEVITEPETLVVAANFIESSRDMGYMSAASAVAELIDNSIQAKATVITITITRESPEALPTITIQDNGAGMSVDELRACLRFGGSARFGDRASLGRFGIGLPASSVSQTRHVTVHSWQPDTFVRRVDLNLDAIASGAPVDLTPRPDPQVDNSASLSGTRVTWSACDRIGYQKLAWLERSLRRELGRIFRDFLANGLTITVGSAPVAATDPLLRGTRVNGVTPNPPMKPLRYDITGPTGKTSPVTVTFSELPVERWAGLDAKQKKALGIVGGGGVTIMRAGREIAAGWLFMGDKRKENYDDWWRCEIRFDPDLDEVFGITTIKQGIRPTPALTNMLGNDLEPIARLLNSRTRAAFEAAKFAAAAQESCRIAEAAEQWMPALATLDGPAGPLSYGLRIEPRAGSTMFASTLADGRMTVTLDRDHAAFDALYGPLQHLDTDDGRKLRNAVELLILSFSRAALEMTGTEQADHLMTSWSAAYSRMVQKL